MKVIENQLIQIKKTILKVNDVFHKEVVDVLWWFNTFLGYQFFHKENKLFVKQGDIYTIDLGKNIGSELNKTRPCVVISNNPFNNGGNIVIIPIKSIKPYSRNGVISLFIEKEGTNLNTESYVSISNIREISKKRIVKKIGKIGNKNIKKIKKSLTIFFGLTKRTP